MKLADLINDSAAEPLHPDLVPYVVDGGLFGQVLKHPLLISPYSSAFTAMLNRAYDQKTKAMAQCLEQEDYEGCLARYERPYRAAAFVSLRHQIDDERYWKIVASEWRLSENVRENMSSWMILLHDERPGRELMMDEDEQRWFNRAPDPLVIYRGVAGGPVGLRGLSWTTDREVAISIASRASMGQYGKNHAVITVGRGVVQKRRVIAYMTGRDEKEVIVMPSHVHARTWERLTVKPA